MARGSKIVPMRKPEVLSAEFREFLDNVVVPALLKKYLAENESQKPLEAGKQLASYSGRSALRSATRRKS
jgi:hypothetical protein